MVLSKQELFDAIRLARPLLILFICIAHIPGIEGFRSSYTQFDQLNTLFTTFLRDFLARGAVPILTVISGYLAYSSYRKRAYGTFVSDKIKRLLVPFLVWNAIALGIAWTFFSLWQIDYGNMAGRHTIWSFLQSLLGIYQLPINPPTYFLRDLFLIMLVVPVIHFLCQRLWWLVLTLAIYIAMFWDQPGVEFSVNEVVVPLVFRADMILFFIVGYLLAVRQIALPRLSVYSRIVCFALLIAVGLLFSVILAVVEPSAREFVRWRTLVGALFVCVTPAILLSLLAIKDTLVGRFLAFYSPYSFTLFLTHILTANGFSFLLGKGLGIRIDDGSSLYYQVIYLVLYLICVSLSAFVILRLWRKFCSMLKIAE